MNPYGAARLNEKGWPLRQIKNHQQSGPDFFQERWMALERLLVKSNTVNNPNHTTINLHQLFTYS